MTDIATTCRLCGSKNLKALFTAKGFPVAQCQRCGFAQVTRAPNPAELETIYNEAYFGHNKYRDLRTLAVENARRLKLMQRYVPAGARALEAGCGSGFFLEAAANTYQMYGFDLSSVGIEQARERNPAFAKRIQQGTLENLPSFEDVSFDVICLWDTIEHIWQPLEALRGLFARLRPGGYLLFSTPDIGALTARLMGGRWAFMTPPEHLSFLNQRSTHYLAETALGHKIVFRASWGKQVNLGFLLYKVRRVLPALMPAALLRPFERPPLANLALYVPTADIQYVVIQKTGE